jgi:RAD51-like protein 2
MEVSALPLPPSIRLKLQCAGFRTTADLAPVQPLDLAQGAPPPPATAARCPDALPSRVLLPHRLPPHPHLDAEAQLTAEEALLALRVALPGAAAAGGLPGAESAAAAAARERAARRIITFSPELDAALGGGVAAGQVTEFCGAPGLGKTQLGIQLAVNAALPAAFSGPAGEAVYIDTEGSFTPERARAIAEAFAVHLRRVAAAHGDAARAAAAAAATADAILAGIHLVRARDAAEQLAAVAALPAFCAARPAVRLVVIDSVAFHFRADFADFGARGRALAGMAAKLMALAHEARLAVVLMNQVTTKPGTGGIGNVTHGTGSGTSAPRLVPALGDAWAHAATSRVVLYWRDGGRRAFLYKSPSLPAAEAEYRVTAEGVRGARRPAKRPREGAAGAAGGGAGAPVATAGAPVATAGGGG